MNKFKLTLKWRFTLLTIFLIALAGAALTVAINIDIQKSIPMTPAAITGQNGDIRINLDMGAFLEMQEQKSLQDEGSITNDDGSITISSGDFEIAMNTAVSNIYITSIITLIIVVCLSGVSAYFVANKALIPIKKLNENIKSINENNLSSTLEVEGPQDEIKELTISYNQMLGKLNNAFTSQKRFNASIAHELKTPLTAIKTNIDVLNEEQDKTKEMYQTTLDVVRDSVNKLNNMIETMLDLVRQENAPLDDEVDINEIIEDVVEDLEFIAKRKDVQINSFLCEELPLIKGNEILLYRGIYNVIENGIKYNEIAGEVNISTTLNQDHIEIQIQDTGRGMKTEEIAHIFEPFYRIDKFNIDTSGGLGLGLSLTKSTIDIHGGEIEVLSELNKGTIFKIKLQLN